MVLTPLRYRLFLLLIAAVLVGIGSQSHRWVNAPAPPPPTQTCLNLHQGCRIQWPQGGYAEVRVDQMPRPLQPFSLKVVTDRPQHNLAASFTMLNMEMGFNRYPLTSADGQHWQGTITLPVCTAGHADWRLTLTTDQEQPAALAFTSER